MLYYHTYPCLDSFGDGFLDPITTSRYFFLFVHVVINDVDQPPGTGSLWRPLWELTDSHLCKLTPEVLGDAGRALVCKRMFGTYLGLLVLLLHYVV